MEIQFADWTAIICQLPDDWAASGVRPPLTPLLVHDGCSSAHGNWIVCQSTFSLIARGTAMHLGIGYLLHSCSKWSPCCDDFIECKNSIFSLVFVWQITAWTTYFWRGYVRRHMWKKWATSPQWWARKCISYRSKGWAYFEKNILFTTSCCWVSFCMIF